MNIKLSSELAKKEPLDRFIAEGTPLFKDAVDRQKKENELLGEQQQLGPLTGILEEWQKLSGGLKDRKELLAKYQKDLADLKEELGNAKKNSSKQKILDEFAKINQTKNEIAELEKKKKGIVLIGDEVLAKVKEYEAAIQKAKIEIAAQKLIVELSADAPVTAQVDVPGEATKTLSLSAGEQVELKAAGSMQLGSSPLHIKIKSGNVDLNGLEKIIQDNQRLLDALVQKHGAQKTTELSE